MGTFEHWEQFVKQTKEQLKTDREKHKAAGPRQQDNSQVHCKATQKASNLSKRARDDKSII